MREDLVAALRPWPDDRRRLDAARELDDRLGDRLRRVRRECLALGDVQRLHAVPRERGGRRLQHSVTSNDGRHRVSGRKCSGERQGLERRLVDHAVGVLAVDENGHTTPICWRTSTTRGAASGP